MTCKDCENKDYEYLLVKQVSYGFPQHGISTEDRHFFKEWSDILEFTQRNKGVYLLYRLENIIGT